MARPRKTIPKERRRPKKEKKAPPRKKVPAKKRALTIKQANAIAAQFYEFGISNTKALINSLTRLEARRTIKPEELRRMANRVYEHGPRSNLKRVKTWKKLEGGKRGDSPEFRLMNPATSTIHRHEFRKKVTEAWRNLQLASHEPKEVKRRIRRAKKALQEYLHVNIAYKKLFSGEVLKRRARLNSIIAETINITFPEVSKRPAIERSGVYDAVVNTDPYLLGFILDNLLTNATKAIDALNKKRKDEGRKERKGRIVVEIKRKRNLTELSVIDNGIGTEKRNLELALLGKHKGWPGRAMPSGGVGMPLVQRALRLLEHTVAIETEEEKGTKITILFKK